jgi:hypothetical protein
VVEEGQHVCHSLFQCVPEFADLDELSGGGVGVDDALNDESPELPVGLQVGGDHALVDPVRGFDFRVPAVGR